MPRTAINASYGESIASRQTLELEAPLTNWLRPRSIVMKKLLLLASLLVIVGVGFLRLGAEQAPQESLTLVQAAERVEDEPAPPELQAQETHKQRVAQIKVAEAPTSEPTVATTGLAARRAPAREVDASSAPMRVVVSVVDSRGRPVSGAELALENAGWNSGGRMLDQIQSRGRTKTTTSQLGRATMDVDQPCRLRVTASAEGYARGASSVIRLTESNPQASVNIRITEGGSVSGRLRDIHGNPAEAIQLSIHLVAWPGESARGMTSVMQRMKTNAEGAFLFTHLTPGDYSLYSSGDPKRVPPQSLKVLVVDGVTTQVEFEDLSQSHVVVKGLVLCNDLPLRNAGISVRSADSQRRGTMVDQTGHFQVILDRGGEYTFTIGSDALGGRAVKKLYIPSELSHPIELRIFTGAISGRIVDLAGKPWPGYQLTAHGKGEEGSWEAETTANDSGEYQFNDLLTGTYMIRSTESMTSRQSAPSARQAHGGSASVSDLVLTRGSSLRNVDLKLLTATALTTSVIDSDGNPAEGAQVLIQFIGTIVPGTSPISSVRSQTNRQGVFLARRLSAGKYQARATLGDQVSRPVMVEALLDTTASVELRLEPGAWINCTILRKGESGKSGFAHLIDADGRVAASASSRDGQLELGPVLPGSYTIRGQSGGGAEKLQAEQALTIVGLEPLSIQLDLR
ncbi:MAG: protocatechuate 3,4-dioxygenase beta subunit [Planctomycetota bacterium]|jgi:protocatechuate 3,4-dioxygenase beta subunit